jgi:hypothetical protein
MDTDYEQEKVLRKTISTTNNLYMDFWVYESEPTGAYSDLEYQSKQLRLYYSEGAPNLSVFNWTGASSQIVVTRYGSDYQNLGYIRELEAENGTWVHHQLEYDLGTTGISDGRVHYYVNGTDILEGETWYLGEDMDALPLLLTGSPSGINQVDIRAYIGNRSNSTPTMDEDIDIWWDDIYVNDTWQRVELCNAAKDHCEIQVPSSWSDTSITATVNAGAFETGDTAYLYVYDLDGDASAAYTVTIDSGATPTYTYCTPSTADSDYYESGTCGSYTSDPGGSYELLSSFLGVYTATTEEEEVTPVVISSGAAFSGTFSGTMQ